MTDHEEILDILSNKDIDALQNWIDSGGDSKLIIRDKSLIQRIIDEIEKEDEEDIYLRILEILIKNGADVNYFDDMCNSAVFDLVRLNKPALLNLILENGATINLIDDESETPLISAALDQNFEVMKLLLPYADQEFINRSGSFHAKTSLGLAFYYGHLEMIELLLQYKADPFVNDGEGYLTIENIPKETDEHLKKKIFDLIEKYKTN